MGSVKKVLALAVVLALVAPALAVCAGAFEPVQTRANHDCCPKEEMAAATTPSTTMNESCCRMSDEAGQRVPAPASQQVVAPQTSVATPAWFHTISSNTPAVHVHTTPASADHVPRHLLLSVLIV